jgi:bifunctional UDP-N-acetylglucosamine pyrophosphorylase/glucosamine-1-phosphate N-acetyltransferase
MDEKAEIVVQPVILAAGKGQRIINEAMAAGLGELPKVLYPLNNRPLLDYVLDAVAAAATELAGEMTLVKPIVVVGFMKDQVTAHVGDRATFVEQLPSPLGTGHAVMVTEEAIDPRATAVLVLNGDMPAWKPSSIAQLCRKFVADRPSIALGTVDFTDSHYTADFFAYGRMVRDESGRLLRIREQRDASDEERQISECNPSLYCFDRTWLFPALHRLKNNNSQAEYYLTDLLEMALAEKHVVETEPCQDWREALGVNTLDQLKLAEELLNT